MSRPAAAGDDRANDGIGIFGIIGRKYDTHVAPAGAELFGDDLRHGAGDVLAHVGLRDIHGHDAVGADGIPDARLERSRGLRGREGGGGREAADHAGGAHADDEATTAEVERFRLAGLDVLVHAFLPAP